MPAALDEECLHIAAQCAVEAHGATVDDGLVEEVKGAIPEDETAG